MSTFFFLYIYNNNLGGYLFNLMNKNSWLNYKKKLFSLIIVEKYILKVKFNLFFFIVLVITTNKFYVFVTISTTK